MFHFLKAILADKNTRYYTILMFAVHPVHVEAVAGIVGRSDLLACLVFLLSGIVYFNVFQGEWNKSKQKG